MFFSEMSIFTIAQTVQSLKKAAVLVDSDCLLCGELRAGEICPACIADLERVEEACPRCALPLPFTQRCGACTAHAPSFDATTAVFTYRFPLERLVHRFKYAGDLAVGRWLANRLALRVRDESRPDIVVVPPVTRARLHERGFNPAGEIGKVVARACGLRVDFGIVVRAREQAPQAGLTRRARLANLRGAFRCTASMRGLDVAIVDDVMTTGATADAMARELKASGAARVRVWAVARTPERGR
jgi:ComF family protein